MASSPLPDHWKALGLDRTADAALIKSTYRKLVLKCHPDKVTDEALKAQKQDEFHKIQQAYETLSDEDRKRTYEAELKLEALRKEKLARMGTSDTKAARFDVRTGTGTASFKTEERKPRSYDDDRKPSRSYDDDRKSSRHDDERYFDTRKYETYDAYPKPSPAARSTREKESKTTRPSNDRTRSDRVKTRDREERSNRKFVGPDHDGSSSDDKALFEEGVRRRDEERREERRREDDRERRRDDERRRESERRKPEERRSDDERRKPEERRYVDQEEEARRYMQSKTRASSRDYEGSSRSRREVRPEAPPRRSSARPVRGPTEKIVDWSPPIAFKHSSSSPADIRIPIRSTPQRSYTESSRDHHRLDSSPPPFLKRSSTDPPVPSMPNTSARRTTRMFRDDTIPEHTSPDREYPPTSTPSSTKKYYYSAEPGMPGVVPVSFRPEDMQPRHVVREPTRRHRSPSPIKTRPPMGPNRHTSASISTASYATPSKGRSSRNVSPVRGVEERGRSSGRPLFGERKTSYEPHEIQFTKQYGIDDVRYSTRMREADEYPRTRSGFHPTATYA